MSVHRLKWMIGHFRLCESEMERENDEKSNHSSNKCVEGINSLDGFLSLSFGEMNGMGDKREKITARPLDISS